MSILAEDNITITSQKTVGDNAAAYTDAAVEGLVPMTGHAEGAIANFEDLLIKDLVTDINPVQDLNGYSKPWVGGAGKNKMPYYSSGSLNGVTFTVNSDGSVQATNKATSTVNYAIDFTIPTTGSYTLTGCPSGGGASSYQIWIYDKTTSATSGIEDRGSGSTGTLDATHEYSCRIRYANGYTANQTFYPMVRLSTAASGYEPYTNICPISGSTEANITRTGKNLFDEQYPSIASAVKYRSIYVGSGTFTMSSDIPIVSGTANLFFLAGQVSSGASSGTNGVGSGTPRTVTATDGYVTVAYRNTGGSNTNSPEDFDTQIEVGSTAHTYEPYNGTTYNVDWTADAGTVYGGTLDVTTGVLTVDKIKISQTWGNFTNSVTLTNYVRRRYDFSTGLYKSSAVATSICNVAPYATGYSSDTLHFYIDTTVTTATRAWVYLPTSTSDSTTIEIVYTLDTPLTYQLTPTQIATLNGVNNVWSSTGNVYVDLVAIRDDSEKLEKVSKLAGDTAQNFWFTGTGTDTGAHITEVSQEEWNDSTSPNYHKGGNLLARSNGIAVRDGLTDLATFSNTGVAVLQNGNEVASFGSTVRIGESTNSNVVIGDNEVIIKDSNTPLSRFRGEGLDVGLNGRMDLGVNVGIGGEGTLSAWSTLGNLNASISNASAGEQGKTGYFTVSNSAGSDGWYGKTLSINNYFREECNITLHSQRDGILTNFPTLRSQVKAEADIISLDADLIKLSSAGALFSTTEATTATLTINGMSNLSGQTLTVTNAGYVPLGIVGTRCNYTSGQTGARNIYLCYLSSSSVGSATITYAVRNLDSAQNKGTIQFYILWVRADAV